MSELNEQQSKAVNHSKGPLLVIAGPGSGKTKVIAHRVKFLIEKKKIDIVLFYLCNLQCCNAVVVENIKKTKEDIKQIVKVAKEFDVKVIFGGEGYLLLKDIHDIIDNSFLTYNNLQKII